MSWMTRTTDDRGTRWYVPPLVLGTMVAAGCASPAVVDRLLADCETRADADCAEGARGVGCRPRTVRACMADEGWERTLFGWVSHPKGLEPVLERCRRESAKKCGPVISGAECVGPRMRACMAGLGWEPAQLGWRKVGSTDTTRREEVDETVPDPADPGE